ncbi:Acetyltransferase (GNAT) family protein [compost metagenome]
MKINEGTHDITIVHDSPSVRDYMRLRELAGLSARSVEGAAIGLENSLFAVTLYAREELVGMGRVIGDGGCFMQIVDIAVRPDFQGRGLGKMVMKELMDYLNREAPPKSFVSLLADVPADQLYMKFGFRYAQPRSQGMYLVID